MSYVGQRVPSLTNTKLVAGRGRFVDDIRLPGMTYAAILRSPCAHAHIIRCTSYQLVIRSVVEVAGRRVGGTMKISAQFMSGGDLLVFVESVCKAEEAGYARAYLVEGQLGLDEAAPLLPERTSRRDGGRRP